MGRHALSQQQAHRSQSSLSGAGRCSVNSASQDARQRYSSPSMVRILARESESSPKRSIPENKDSVALQSSKAIPLWTDDRVANRTRSALDEYTELRDSTELTASLDEVPELNKGYRCAFELALKRVLEGNDLQRAAALEVSRIILDGKHLCANEVTNLLLETLEFLPDIAIDSPKATSHVADLLTIVIKLGVIPVEWLTQDSGRKIGESTCESVPERGQLFSELAMRFNDDPQKAALLAPLMPRRVLC